jgi:hypothetical protein
MDLSISIVGRVRETGLGSLSALPLAAARKREDARLLELIKHHCIIAGMVGLPKQTQNGITVRMLLNPGIKIGRRTRLDNSSRVFSFLRRGSGVRVCADLAQRFVADLFLGEFGVVVRLEVHPALRIDTEVRTKTHRGIGRDGALALHDFVDAAGRDADRLRQCVLADAHRLQPVERQDFAGRRQGYFSCHDSLRLLCQW